MAALMDAVKDVPPRPLLFAVGPAATASGISCYEKRGYGEKTTADPEDTTVAKGEDIPQCWCNYTVLSLFLSLFLTLIKRICSVL